MLDYDAEIGNKPGTNLFSPAILPTLMPKRE